MDIENQFELYHKILYTDTIEELKTQIDILNSSKNIFLSDGSAFLVNGLFCINSNINVLGDVVVEQSKNFFKMEYICQLIERNNIVKYIPYINGNINNSIFYYNDIKKYIHI